MVSSIFPPARSGSDEDAERFTTYQGSQLLRNSRVRAAIRKRMQERSERTKISADYVIQRLKEEAEYDGEGASPMARVKALELLGKHLGMFWDRKQTVEHAEAVYVEVPPPQPAAMLPGAEGRDGEPHEMPPEKPVLADAYGPDSGEPADSPSPEEKESTT